jgi:drug/metabolite transporter (DMT)-like permease
VNTAFAFTLWNKTLQTLTAVQSSIINNTMLIQIAVLAWIFLGEQITPGEIGGLLLVVIGTLIVQITRSKS